MTEYREAEELVLGEVKSLLDTGGENYSVDKGYQDLQAIENAVSIADKIYGKDFDENYVRSLVAEFRDDLREQGYVQHADELEGTLVNPGGTTKHNCSNVPGGNGRRLGHPEGPKWGPSGIWKEGDYEDHSQFELCPAARDAVNIASPKAEKIMADGGRHELYHDPEIPNGDPGIDTLAEKTESGYSEVVKDEELEERLDALEKAAEVGYPSSVTYNDRLRVEENPGTITVTTGITGLGD